MGKRSFLIALAVVVCGALVLWLFPLAVVWLDERQVNRAITEEEMSRLMAERHGKAPEPQPVAERLDLKRPVRLAIGGIGLGDEDKNRQVSEHLLAELGKAVGLEMVERQSFDAVLRELNLSAAGLVRAKDAVRVGKLIRADWFLLGSGTRLNGTNYSVVRLVDARTGVLREAAVFESSQAAPRLASALAEFVRRCRQNAAEAKPAIYLAVGSFEDLSVNSRQAALPSQLRSYLISAYQRTNVTMLEREFASTLLREMYLDLAGLTEESLSNTPKPMPAAYWMVDGFYQSYETTNFQVELVLNVRRMFGKNQQIALREKPGEVLFRRVKDGIDGVMNRDRAALSPTRMTELHAQLSVGSELLQSVQKSMGANAVGGWLDYTGGMSPTEVARHRRNIEEAVRAFEVALLLDPGNRQATAGLAGCYSTPLAGRFDEARVLYRELIDAPLADKWTDLAQRELVWSFQRFVSPEEKRRWFESATALSANQRAREFFQSQSKTAAEDVVLQQHETPEAEKVAEERLFRDIKGWEKQVRDHAFIVDFDNTGLGKYAQAFGTNQALAARKMVTLLPKLQAASTNLAPHIFAGVVTFQVDTNAPIIKEFERSLDEFAEKSPPYFASRYYVNLLASPVYYWAEKLGLYKLAAKMKEIQFRAADRDRSVSVSDEDRMGLAFNYLRAESWQKALDIFQSYSNRPVEMGNSGLWGRAFTVVLTSKQAALCRDKLRLSPVIDSRLFDLGEPCLHPHSRNTYYDTLTFLTASDGLWIGLNDQVMQVDFNLKTNFVAQLSPSSSAPVSTLCMGASNVWIGTAGDGLFELDKSTHKITGFTEKDGLLMDYISSLWLAGDALWIGYGNEASGGLGRFDLTARRFVSFSASLSGETASAKPPRVMVAGIQSDSAGDIWFITKSTLSKYRPVEDAWETWPNKNGVWVRWYVRDGERLIKGLEISQVELTIETMPNANGASDLPQRIKRVVSIEESAVLQATLKTNRGGQQVAGSSVGGNPSKGGLELWTFAPARQQRLLEPEGLSSPPTALTLQGRELWVGGQGFVALVDIDENRIKKLAYVPARKVDQIQVGGGFLWVQFDKHIYRTLLNDLK